MKTYRYMYHDNIFRYLRQTDQAGSLMPRRGRVRVGGLGCEVSKNLVLSGVKELKMVENSAEASLQRLQQMNHMVRLICS